MNQITNVHSYILTNANVWFAGQRDAQYGMVCIIRLIVCCNDVLNASFSKQFFRHTQSAKFDAYSKLKTAQVDCSIFA